MSEADFDKEFARLQAGAEALAAVVAQNPELAAQFAAVMDAAVPDAQAAEQQAQEVARANALKALNERVRQTLAAGTSGASTPEPEPAPQPESD